MSAKKSREIAASLSSGELPSWPCHDPDVLVALQAAYQDGSWGRYHGPHVQNLAKKLVDMCQAEFCLTCASGTFAVELALRSLNIGSNDEVILAGYDFPGNFRAIEAVGAKPVLVDIGPNDFCPDIQHETLKEAVGPTTRAIIVSHLHGTNAPMRDLCERAREFKLMVIEDACQATGAVVDGRAAGSWGDVGVLSFGGSKLLTAGRGGAMLTQSESIFQRAKIFCERGNHAFPLSELQAAVLLPQCDKLNERNQRRHENARWLVDQLKDVDDLRPCKNLAAEECGGGLIHAGQNRAVHYKLAWSYLPAIKQTQSRDQFLQSVRNEGIDMGAGFRGFHRRSTNRCRHSGPLANAEAAAESIVLLHHPVLLEGRGKMEHVARTLSRVVGELQVS